MNELSSMSNYIQINTIERIDQDMLYMEMYDHQANTYKHTCVKYGPSDRQFYVFKQFVSNVTQRIVSMKMAKQECLIFHSPDAPNVGVYCLNSNALEHKQEIESAPVQKAITLIDEFHSSLVLLSVAGPLQIWLETVAGKLTLKQTIELLNPSWVTATPFQHFNYIAVCSEPMNNSVHYGAIEIYRAAEKGDYYQFQKISIKLPKQIEFSVLPSQELVLYVLTENPIQPFIVYRYAGVEGFKEFVLGSTLPKGHHFTVMTNQAYRKEFVVFNANGDALIIEGVLI